ncbi:hypothetical protein B4U80_14121 [Leptotrombidium deliense]|uniref:TIL domain-containing protein n=1 Tax=Leptotrombidium deliense TaxID=299467 RepID=A0A443S262_9ACAR|nr:hypothetical protein B4U80_14121 [Leptotrombidium deliense]
MNVVVDLFVKILRLVNGAENNCDDPNEVRMECAPNKACETCGESICTRECVINGCICKPGYKYKNNKCILEKDC